jgi:hypothetical protein
MLLTKPEQDVIQAMRGGAKLKRLRDDLCDIEATLKMYDVPIISPLSDAVLMVCERNERLEDLLQQCYKVVGNDDLAKRIEEVLSDDMSEVRAANGTERRAR